MTLEQDVDALSRLLNAENVREDATLGRTIEGMRIQLLVLKRQLRNRRGYSPYHSAGTGATGATGPAA